MTHQEALEILLGLVVAQSKIFSHEERCALQIAIDLLAMEIYEAKKHA